MVYANVISTLWECMKCGYRWWAPNAKRCPRCHHEELKKLHEQKLDYERI